MASIYSLGRSLEFMVTAHATMQGFNNQYIENLMDRVDVAVRSRSDKTWNQGFWNMIIGGGTGGLGILANFIPGASSLADLSGKVAPMITRTVDTSIESGKLLDEAEQQKLTSIHIQQKQTHQREMHDQLTRFIQTWSQIQQQMAQARRTAAGL